MIRYKQTNSDGELQQILTLQQENLPKNLTKEELRTQGFLTVTHTFDLLKKMNDVFPHTIAVHHNKVIGYALSMHPRFADEIELLRPMFSEINKVVEVTSDCMVMGQICIAKTYRGLGIFRKLYGKMQEFLAPSFTRIITEVDTSNIRSLQAHTAIGFCELKRYMKKGREWSLVLLEIKKPKS